MSTLRFAMFGAGFWARYQLAAWQELKGVECVAIYNRTRAKGERFAREFEVPAVYDDPEELLQREHLDFVDIVTYPFTLSRFVKLAAAHKIPVISQKPMAPSVEVAEENLKACHEAHVPYFIHENWRWQSHLRELKGVLDSGVIGRPFRARISMVSAYPVFINEPQIKDLEEFILTDMGTHILDIARFYFGEAQNLYCQVHQIHPDIKGEDVATVMMMMEGHTTVTCEMGYPENYVEHDYFPQTLIYVEGDKGSAEIARGYWLRVTTREGTHARRYPPVRYAWADPDYLVVHSSIVSCNLNFLQALRGEGIAETTGEDNVKTLRLVFAAYNSARSGNAVRLDGTASEKWANNLRLEEIGKHR
ncbi:MAG TPA: Gfo/Idh/MocA family oxidoreductase [Terriglobia bacterium]|nr:Gfo/Idh/MocA family oxidoreductase [Terriglobia bacterium]